MKSKYILSSVTFTLFLMGKVSAQMFTNYTTANGLTDNIVLSIAIDNQDNKWFGTRNGLTKFDGTTWTPFTKQNSAIVDSVVNSIAIDQAGNKWIATRNGVSKFDGTTWSNYKTIDGLANNFVLSVAIDNLNNKWFGTFDGGLSQFDGTTWTTYSAVTGGVLLDHRINTLSVNKTNNDLWVGYYLAGACKFDGTTWTPYPHVANDTISGYGNALALSYGNIRAITMDSLGGKWFGSTSFGTSWLDETNQWTRYYFSNPLDKEKNYINAIAIDNSGRKWFGTWGAGLLCFDGTTWTNYTTKNSNLIDDHIHSIVMDSLGAMWIGTYGGVSKMTEQSNSIKSNVAFNSFSIFPVPSNDFINIVSDAENCEISLVDVNGNSVSNKKIQNKIAIFDITKLSSGTYFLVLKEKNGLVTSKKILKQ